MCGGAEFIPAAAPVVEEAAAKGAGEVIGETGAAVSETAVEAAAPAAASTEIVEAPRITDSLLDSEGATTALRSVVDLDKVGTAATVLKAAKETAPLISAGASVAGASAGIQASKAATAATAGLKPATPPAVPAAVIDPDLTQIRKRNAVLFGLDSPASTDITKGKAAVGDLGRVTLLGGTSNLG